MAEPRVERPERFGRPETGGTPDPVESGPPPAAASSVVRTAPRVTPRLTRRAVLRSLAAAAVGTTMLPLIDRLDALVPAAAGAGEAADPEARRRWVMVMDLRRCDGCGECTKACQEMHFLEPEQTWLKVYEIQATGHAYFMPRVCMQCDDPPCQRVCPVGATFTSKDGVVLVDQDKCIGCRLCMAACPYEARYFNWTEPTRRPPLPVVPTPEFPSPQRVGTVGKCTFCVHRTRHGMLPACVEGCPMGVIYIGDLDADVATNGDDTVRLSTFLLENHAVRFKEELNTGPAVYYILGHGQDLEF